MFKILFSKTFDYSSTNLLIILMCVLRLNTDRFYFLHQPTNIYYQLINNIHEIKMN